MLSRSELLVRLLIVGQLLLIALDWASVLMLHANLPPIHFVCYLLSAALFSACGLLYLLATLLQLASGRNVLRVGGQTVCVLPNVLGPRPVPAPYRPAAFVTAGAILAFMFARWLGVPILPPQALNPPQWVPPQMRTSVWWLQFTGTIAGCWLALLVLALALGGISRHEEPPTEGQALGDACGDNEPGPGVAAKLGMEMRLHRWPLWICRAVSPLLGIATAASILMCADELAAWALIGALSVWLICVFFLVRCPRCGTFFDKAPEADSGGSWYQCTRCNRMFPTPGQFLVHLWRSGESLRLIGLSLLGSGATAVAFALLLARHIRLLPGMAPADRMSLVATLGSVFLWSGAGLVWRRRWAWAGSVLLLATSCAAVATAVAYMKLQNLGSAYVGAGFGVFGMYFLTAVVYLAGRYQRAPWGSENLSEAPRQRATV